MAQTADRPAPPFVTAVQCRDESSGEVGSFITETGSMRAISPVFPDLYYLYRWMHQNGWEIMPQDGWRCRRKSP